jgi:hypothetical protein
MRYVFLAILLCVVGTVEAAPVRGYLTQEEIEQFYLQGYFLKRQCLGRDEVETLSRSVSSAIDRALAEIAAAPDPAVSEQDQFLYAGGSRVVYRRRPDGTVSIARINGVAGVEPSLANMVRSPTMVATFFDLLGTRELEHLISQIHPKLPGDGIAYPRHRDIQFRKSFDPDWQDILGNGSYAICVLPVDPMNEANGGLWIDRNNYPEPRGEPEDLVWIDAEPGDLLFMHPYLFHGSGPNLSPCSRRTLLTGFCAFGANHKPYPGVDVNVRVTLGEGGAIAEGAAPWSQTPCARKDPVH